MDFKSNQTRRLKMQQSHNQKWCFTISLYVMSRALLRFAPLCDSVLSTRHVSIVAVRTAGVAHSLDSAARFYEPSHEPL